MAILLKSKCESLEWFLVRIAKKLTTIAVIEEEHYMDIRDN